MENTKRSEKERALNEFAAYVKNNPGISYAEAAKAMHNTPRTIRRWCKKLDIELTASRSTPQLDTTDEEKENLDELDEATDEVDRKQKYIQEQISLKDKRIAELESQITDDKDVLRRQEREFYKASLEKQMELFTQIQQDYDMALQEARESREHKAAVNEAAKRVKEQNTSAMQRLDWEMANMNKVAEVQKNLAAAEAKVQSQPQSPLGDLGKLLTITDALEERAASRIPAQSSGGGISYQATSAEEYEKLADVEYKRSGRQARDEMMRSVLSPLKDYLFQRFGFGLQQQRVQQMPPQQTVFQQQAMPAQPQQQPTQESSYESPKPQASQPVYESPKPQESQSTYEPPKPQESQSPMAYVFCSPEQYDVPCPVCNTPVPVPLDSISASRCSRCNIIVLAVKDSPGNSKYIKQIKSNQWTDELIGKIQLAVQRFKEAAMIGLGLNAQPLISKSGGNSSDPLMGTFLATAVREGIKRWLGGVDVSMIESLAKKNVDADDVWEMVPQGFRQSMDVYANEHPNELRYVLNPVWVREAVQDANPSLGEYFANHSTGRAWLDGIISGFRSKLNV